MASTTPNNTKDLKAWVAWAKKQKGLSDDVPHFVKAVEDLISQASMVPALKAQLEKGLRSIRCQACKPTDTGCSSCGGFKVKLERIFCQCGHKYWDYPRRGMTVYEGKEYVAFDGTTVHCHIGKPDECSKCHAERRCTQVSDRSARGHVWEDGAEDCICGKWADGVRVAKNMDKESPDGERP